MYSYKYPRPALTVDAIVFTRQLSETFILLIERGKEPYKGKWALPGGFVEMDELLEKACIRELEEETGIKVSKMRQYKTYDEVERDPRHRTISVVYTAELPSKKEVKGGDDANCAAWHPVSKLPELAFDHQKILNNFFNGQ
jgi:8-oxo-dGTP diphosphatase